MELQWVALSGRIAPATARHHARNHDAMPCRARGGVARGTWSSQSQGATRDTVDSTRWTHTYVRRWLPRPRVRPWRAPCALAFTRSRNALAHVRMLPLWSPLSPPPHNPRTLCSHRCDGASSSRCTQASSGASLALGTRRTPLSPPWRTPHPLPYVGAMPSMANPSALAT